MGHTCGEIPNWGFAKKGAGTYWWQDARWVLVLPVISIQLHKNREFTGTVEYLHSVHRRLHQLQVEVYLFLIHLHSLYSVGVRGEDTLKDKLVRVWAIRIRRYCVRICLECLRKETRNFVRTICLQAKDLTPEFWSAMQEWYDPNPIFDSKSWGYFIHRFIEKERMFKNHKLLSKLCDHISARTWLSVE